MSFSIPLKSPGTVAPKMEAQLEAKDSSGDEMPNAEEPELPPRHRSLSPELPPRQQGASPELASLGVEHEKETKLAIGSGAPSRRRIRLEAEIFRALNLARTNPLQMAEELVKLSIQMNDEKHLVFDWGVVETQEGQKGLEEAIFFLTHKQRTTALKSSAGLQEASRKHVDHLCENQLYDHMEHSHVLMHGDTLGDYVEAIEYGPWKTGLQFVAALLVEDGAATKFNRNVLLDGKMKTCGVACSDEYNYQGYEGSCCVICFAEEFVERAEPRDGDVALDNGSEVPSLKPDSVMVELEKKYEKDIEQGKRQFATGLLIIGCAFVVLAVAVNATTGFAFDEVSLGLNFYLLLLIWSDTLYEKGQWQVKLFCALLFGSSLLYFFRRVEEQSPLSLWLEYLFGVPILVVSMGWVLTEISGVFHSMKLHSKTDHSLKTTSRMMHVFPLVLLVVAQLVLEVFSERVIVKTMCTYMPGAFFEKDFAYPMTSATGKWQNCTTPDKIEKFRPTKVVSGSDTMLELYIVNFARNELSRKVATYRLFEISMIAVTTQVMYGMCRMTMEDVVALSLSREELLLWVVTAVRLTLVLGIGALNIDYMQYSSIVTLTNVICITVGILYFVACALMILIVREVKTTTFLEASDKSGRSIAEKGTDYEKLMHLRMMHKNGNAAGKSESDRTPDNDNVAPILGI
jgi:hypothetical protein